MSLIDRRLWHPLTWNYVPADPGVWLFADVKIRRENKIYPVISDHELERTLAQINTKSLVGKRDMAMILLGVSTGMRAADIVNLKLHDIDWLNGELHLVQNKTANPVVLPLMRNVGEALKDYNRHVR